MPAIEFPGNLVSTEWLQEHLDDEGVVVLDASWHLPAKERNGREEWEKVRIPGAGYFDYHNDVADPETELPHMLPGESLFTESAQSLGVNRDSLVVVYDTNQMFSSPRAWWMFRAMGHEQVAVLDGGLVAWQASGYPIEEGDSTAPSVGNFTADKNDRFIDADYVMGHLSHADTMILDARSDDRYAAGHMPGAHNLPYSNLLEGGKMKSVDELKAIFSTALDGRKDLLCSCGSGVTACVLALGANLAGFDNTVVYDGSWTEWGADGADYPVEVNS